MSYEEMPAGTVPVFFVLVFSTFSCFLLTIILAMKWKERRRRSVYSLRNLFFSLFLACIFLISAMIQGYITGYKLIFYRIAYTLFIGFLACSLFFLIQFGQEIFNVFKKSYNYHFIFIAILVILLILPNNYYGFPSDGKTDFGPSIRIFSSTLFVVYQTYLYALLAIKSFSAYLQVSDSYAKIGFMFIGISQVSMLANQFFLVLDVIAFTFWGNKGGYSIFTTIGWIFVGLFTFSSYMGLLLPGFLHRRELPNTSLEKVKSQLIEEDPIQVKIAEIHDRSLLVRCPTCKLTKEIVLKSELVYSIKIQEKDIMSITIEENIICPHRFQIYLDKNLQIRGFTPIDYFKG
ncbi:hypothetical protein [Candidatus Lokiarchaeum ossiferum]